MKNSLALAFILCSIVASGQKEAQGIIDEFFDLYRSKGSDPALDYLFGTNKWMDNSKDQIEGVKLKLNGTIRLIGTYEGFELITKKDNW